MTSSKRDQKQIVAAAANKRRRLRRLSDQDRISLLETLQAQAEKYKVENERLRRDLVYETNEHMKQENAMFNSLQAVRAQILSSLEELRNIQKALANAVSQND